MKGLDHQTPGEPAQHRQGEQRPAHSHGRAQRVLLRVPDVRRPPGGRQRPGSISIKIIRLKSEQNYLKSRTGFSK